MWENGKNDHTPSALNGSETRERTMSMLGDMLSFSTRQIKQVFYDGFIKWGVSLDVESSHERGWSTPHGLLESRQL